MYNNPAIGAIIERLYETRSVRGRSGIPRPLDSEIDAKEGRFLCDLIGGDTGIVKTLEVGCAYGLSSLHICDALSGRDGASHTVIEPFPEYWDHVGLMHLQEAGVEAFQMVHERSEFALPRLLQQAESSPSSGFFDLVFIDGFHTFDQTLVDCFFATRLLRVGGYLVIDDLWMPAVRRVANSLLTYPCYEFHAAVNDRAQPKRPMTTRRRLSRRVRSWFAAASGAPPRQAERYQHEYEHLHPRMIALRKIADDERPWDWYDARF